jgi:hypothetical protein
MPYRFFLAGIIQGSKRGLETFDQGYRERIKFILNRTFPHCDLICPVENHPDSVLYSDEEAKATFLANVKKAKQSDALIVYLPEASMGSSIEMWEAYHCRIPVFTITPLASNWVVRILSDQVFPGMEEFEAFIRSGDMERMLRKAVSAQMGTGA